MIDRTLEPESMDSREEATAYALMDHEEVNKVFVDDLFAGGKVGKKVIDLGCGPALIAIEIASRDPAIALLGVDTSVEMLELAKTEIDMAGMLYQVSLEHADAKSMEQFEDAMADTVVSNTVLHHLEDPNTLLRTAMRLTRPGGRIFIRDLVRPDSENEVEDLIDKHAREESGFAQQQLRQSLHAALTLVEIRSIVDRIGIDPSSVAMTSDRHWTIDWTR